MTETNLWIVTGVWALIIALPLAQKVWFQYLSWAEKNFGNKE